MMDADGFFDAKVAASYDDDPAMTDPVVIDVTVAFLAELAGRGSALEFAIGTGRVALPLAAHGVSVAGIEMSRAMHAVMQTKSGADAIPVTIGNMATTRVSGSFSLVYLVYNTINNLTTQADQCACFRNAADHLIPGGSFVIEVGVPALQRLPMGERFVPFDVGPTHWGVDEYDVVTQSFWSHHMHLGDGQARLNSVPFRYVWPAELDLMAQMAGLALTGRYANWKRDPFTANSRSHVSVWTRI